MTEGGQTINEKLDPRWGEYSPVHDPKVLAYFVPRPADVLITTAPKAGTTWMQQILHQLRTGGDDSFKYIDDVVPWLERPRRNRTWREVLKYYEGLADPRLFKTHCTYPQTPGVETVRIILSSRDPRDCCVSFYHHLMDMTDQALAESGHRRPGSFEEFFERWMAFGSWFRNVRSWWPHINDPNVLWLRYEDMKAGLSGTIDRILEFLGWDLADAHRDRVLHYCSFEWMRAHADRFSASRDSNGPMFVPGGFIRKGTVGDHKQLLKAEHERRILERARSELAPKCLAFLGIDEA